MTAVGGRIIRLQALRHRGNFLLRLLQTGAGFQTAVRFNPTLTAIFEFVAAGLERVFHGSRHPKLHRPADECSVKTRGGHANNRVKHTVHALRLADDLRITSEAFLPELVTDNRHGMGAAPPVLMVLKRPAENWMNSQRIEIVRGNNAPGYDLRAVADAERCPGDLAHEKRVKQFAVSLKVQEIRPGKRGTVSLALSASGSRESYQPFLICNERVRTKKKSLHPTENRSISADAKRQAKNRQKREAGTAPKHSQGKAKILQQSFKKRQTTRFTVVFLGLLRAAEADESLAARFVGRQTALEILLDGEFQMM